MNFLAKAKLVLALLPAVIQAVKGIEEALPYDGLGQEKLALVRQALEAVVDGVDEYWDVIEKLINVVVSLFNATGLFAKAS